MSLDGRLRRTEELLKDRFQPPVPYFFLVRCREDQAHLEAMREEAKRTGREPQRMLFYFPSWEAKEKVDLPGKEKGS